jgi:hypothetical protein
MQRSSISGHPGSTPTLIHPQWIRARPDVLFFFFLFSLFFFALRLARFTLPNQLIAAFRLADRTIVADAGRHGHNRASRVEGSYWDSLTSDGHAGEVVFVHNQHFCQPFPLIYCSATIRSHDPGQLLVFCLDPELRGLQDHSLYKPNRDDKLEHCAGL